MCRLLPFQPYYLRRKRGDSTAGWECIFEKKIPCWPGEEGDVDFRCLWAKHWERLHGAGREAGFQDAHTHNCETYPAGVLSGLTVGSPTVNSVRKGTFIKWSIICRILWTRWLVPTHREWRACGAEPRPNSRPWMVQGESWFPATLWNSCGTSDSAKLHSTIFGTRLWTCTHSPASLLSWLYAAHSTKTALLRATKYLRKFFYQHRYALLCTLRFLITKC